MQPLATTYADPANICGYTYSRPEPTRRNLSAMISETTIVLEQSCLNFQRDWHTYRWLEGLSKSRRAEVVRAFEKGRQPRHI